MTNKKLEPRVFPGEVSTSEVGALVCDVIMLAIFLWNQLVYGLDMMALIIPLALIGLWLLLFCVVPEVYRFEERALLITHRFRRTVSVSYTSVFNYDAVARDGFVNLLRSNRVKVYYTHDGKRRMAVCLPRDVEGFVDTLKARCPEFDAQDSEESRLAVFFGDRPSIDTEKENQDE